MEKQLNSSNNSKKALKKGFFTTRQKAWLSALVLAIVGPVAVFYITRQNNDKENKGLSSFLNSDDHSRNISNNSTHINTSKHVNKFEKTANLQKVNPVVSIGNKNKSDKIEAKQQLTLNPVKDNGLTKQPTNNKTNINNSKTVTKTMQDTINNIKGRVVKLDTPREKSSTKGLLIENNKKIDTSKSAPVFKPRVVPKTKMNKLVISTGDDEPWFHIDSTNKYSEEYRARNLGGIYFWTDCLDCNWYVVFNHSGYYDGKHKQGVIVSYGMPSKKMLDSSLYYEVFANEDYEFYVLDKSGNEDEKGWVVVQPGQTKIIYIGKRLPPRK